MEKQIKPATEAQQNYARELAAKKGVTLDESIFADAKATSAFLTRTKFLKNKVTEEAPTEEEVPA